MKFLLIKLFELFLSEKDLNTLIRLVRDKWRDYVWRYAIAFAFMAVVAGTTAMSAWLMKDVVNRIFVTRDAAAVVWLPVLVVVLYTAKGGATYFQDVILGRIGNRIVAETQKQIFSNLLKQDMVFFARHPSSDLITRLTANANSARDALNMIATSFGRDLLTLCGLIAVMVGQQPLMFAICALGAPIGMYVQKTLVKRVQKVTRSEFLSYGQIVNTMRETAQGIRVVKAFTLEHAMGARMDRAVTAVENRNNKLNAINARTNPMVDTLGGIAVAGVILYAGWRSLSYGEAPGEFFSFITALLMAYEPARRLGRLQVRMAQACIGVQMMFELMDAQPQLTEKDGAVDLDLPKGEIRFDDVSFGYNTAEPVLKQMNLTCQPGQTTALVGLSGSGKSTIMNLILRFWDPWSGRVLLDGQSVADVRIASLRSQIALVSQDVFLFEGTIGENIMAGREGATEAEMLAASKAAYAHHFIEGLPRGYNTMVGELGAQLSGGQRQRVSIARAFLKNAPIILLDEPTSALDSESEQAIQRALATLTERKTTLVIAHRLATVLNADCIYVLDNGQIAESGTHAQLLRNNGLYARLYEIQYAPHEREAV